MEKNSSQMAEARSHHVWCNHFMRPREGCRMCEGLFKDYPYGSAEESDNLMAKHFPQNIRREDT